MDLLVESYGDVLGLRLKFQAPGWSEFVTGDTALALHPATQENPAVNVTDLEKFYQEMTAKGLQFSMPPTKQDFGGFLAQFVDSDGARCSVGGEQ
jgi:uncharacterized glyoxalase superfamily protein PhnB